MSDTTHPFDKRIHVPAIIGHRGARGHAPENTLAGLRTAKTLGIEWVEFDVMLSADGRPVLIHDETLTRTTNGEGRVAETPLEGLKALDAGSWFGPDFKGEKIPTLEETLSLLGELNLGANVEIKPAEGFEVETGRVTAEVLQRVWPDHLPAPVLSSFKPDALAAARAQAPEFPCALLVWKFPKDWRQQLERLECTALHASQQHLTEAQAKAVLAAGYGLRVYTVNNRLLARRLFDWGVESLFTDFPERMPENP